MRHRQRALRRRQGSTSVEAVYAEAWPGLVRFARLLTASDALGEDIAQEAFLGLLRHRSRVENPVAYLRRSVVNLVINARKRDANERRYLVTVRSPSVEPPTHDDLWPLIRRLPARQRAVLVLRYYEDLPEREIADVLGCRPGTVKSLASRALLSLRKDVARNE